MISLPDVLALVVPPLAVAAIIWMDLRSRRGYGLGLLALAQIGYSVWLIAVIPPALPYLSSSDGFAISFVLVIYAAIAVYAALLVWLGALIEAGMGRQRWWMVGLILAAAPQVWALLTGPTLAQLARESGASVRMHLALALLPLSVVALAYSARRIVRPPRERAA